MERTIQVTLNNSAIQYEDGVYYKTGIAGSEEL